MLQRFNAALWSKPKQKNRDISLGDDHPVRLSYFSSRDDKFTVELIPAEAAWWNKQSAICDTACDVLRVQV